MKTRTKAGETLSLSRNLKFLMKHHKVDKARISAVTGIQITDIEAYIDQKKALDLMDMAVLSEYFGVPVRKLISSNLETRKMKVVPERLYGKPLVIILFSDRYNAEPEIARYNPEYGWYLITGSRDDHPSGLPVTERFIIDPSRVVDWRGSFVYEDTVETVEKDG